LISLSIVIPVYNAEKTIADLCSELVSLLNATCRLDIVLVNDCSSDGSDAVCKRLLENFAGVITYVRLSRNFGEHNAVMAGLNQARGEYVVIMDDDFQNPPEEVSRLLNEIQKGFDVVYSRYPEKNDSIFRNMGSYLNGTMARIVLDKPANLYLSSFKILNRFMVDQLVMYKNPNPYLDAIILNITRNIGTVEVRHNQRRDGASGYTLKKLIALWGDMIVSYSLIPLRVMALLGLIMALLGSYSVLEMLFRTMHPMIIDPTALEELISISSFFRGVQLLATGIVGEYVGRIYLKLNQEPQFVIRELSGDNPEHLSKGGTVNGR